MPTIYITDQTREMLDRLKPIEKRGISDEIELLCEKRIKELGLHDVNIPSNGSLDSNKTESSCQEVSHV